MRGGAALPVAPILVGSMHRFLRTGKGPAHDGLTASVLEAVRKATAGRKALYVASGDLAHVGPAFDGAPLDAAGKEEIRAADGRLLRHMEAGDAEGYFAEIRRMEDMNNVCGTTPIYLTLRTLQAGAHLAQGSAHAQGLGRGVNGSSAQPPTGVVEGETVGYALCPADEEDTSVVSVAGVLWRGLGA
jgi:hypothetical protein